LTAIVTPFPLNAVLPSQVGFDRTELTRILDLYGRMVAAGKWRRSAERPEYRIIKNPALRQKQGIWALMGEGGGVLKRGDELGPVLAPVERKLLKLVEG
jgi:Protein of unknown function (DUF2794)